MLRRRSRVVAEMNSIASLSLVMPSRREAMLVVSPIAVYSTRCSEPTLTQAEGSEVVSGTDGTESISGTLKGDIFTYHSSVGGYEAQVTLTVAANGLSWSGPLHDNNGTSGTDTAHRNTPLGSGKPSPVLAKTGNVATVSGRVQVKPPGSRSFVALSKLRQIPFGTIVNATNGTVGVTTATPSGATQTGKFFGGEFVLTQGGSGMVLATLTGGSFSACPTAPERSRIARAGTASAQATASGSHTVRKLWANAHGKFSTKGNYAAAAVQGTEWLTEDLCEGTLIPGHARQGCGHQSGQPPPRRGACRPPLSRQGAVGKSRPRASGSL